MSRKDTTTEVSVGEAVGQATKYVSRVQSVLAAMSTPCWLVRPHNERFYRRPSNRQYRGTLVKAYAAALAPWLRVCPSLRATPTLAARVGQSSLPYAVGTSINRRLLHFARSAECGCVHVVKRRLTISSCVFLQLVIVPLGFGKQFRRYFIPKDPLYMGRFK